jgi:cyclohexanecarboxyl-CoA dehydrogenase
MRLSDEQRSLQHAARRFSRERLSPGYQKREQDARMDRTLLREMGALGLLGVDVAPEYGGLGVDGVTTGLIVEELAYGDFNIGAVMLVMSLCGAIIARNASPEVAAEWLPRIPRGEAILALSITEPKCGSDASAIELKARRKGGFYVLNGEKTSTTYCDCADAFVVFARTGSVKDGARGVTAFLVPSNTPGIHSQAMAMADQQMWTQPSIIRSNFRPARSSGWAIEQ